MRNTQSALKWLAEKRARVAHDLDQTSRMAEQLTLRADGLRLDLAALDRSLCLYHDILDPASIAPVKAWKGKYGARGDLRQAIEAVLKENAPEWVSTDNIEVLVCARLDISFETTSRRKRWYDNTFARQLRRLVDEELVERYHDATLSGNEFGRWRWRAQALPSLADL